MKTISSLLLLFLTLPVVAQEAVHIIPQPVSILEKPGSFAIDEQTSIHLVQENAALKEAAYFFIDAVQDISSIKLTLGENKDKKITLDLGSYLAIGKEGYRLDASPDEIKLCANPVSSYYQADGPNSLTDGIQGTETITKFWHGFYQDDFIATIDLGTIKSIQSIALGCIQKYRDWIFLPESVSFEVSVDGREFEEIKSLKNPVNRNQELKLYDFEIKFPVEDIRYVRVKAKNTLCPEDHPGAGKPAWIFVDEIIVN